MPGDQSCKIRSRAYISGYVTREYFEKIFVITHNPLVTNWSDNVVKIRKEENISFVSQ